MMRRPDVFELNHSHPLGHGLLWFPHFLRGRDDSIINLARANERIPKAGNSSITEHSGLFGRPAVSTPAAADGYYYTAPTFTVSLPVTLSMWQYIGSTYSGIGGTCPLLRAGTYNTLRLGAINAYGSPYLLKFQAAAAYTSVFDYALMESSQWSARFAHLAVHLGQTSQSAFFDGVKVAEASVSLSASYTVTPCVATDGTTGCVGFVADTMVHQRLLSPAEIAILADRTDPMLGGLIVEERPVLYFDLGGSTDVTGTLSAIESGADTLDSAGSVLVSGSLASSESGGDTTSSSGAVLIQGTLSAAESGADTLVAYGGSAFPAISGEMDVAESGEDTSSASGSVIVSGSLSASESNVDAIAVIGQLLVSGLMDATEVGDDTYAELLAISASEVHRSVSLAAYSYVSVLPDEDYTARA